MSQEDVFCNECGRKLKRPTFCNLDNQTSEYIAPDCQPEHGEYGLQPIGPCCAAKLKIPNSWLITEERHETL
jgi:hypothetical protein